MAVLKPDAPVLYTTRFFVMGGPAEVRFVGRQGTGWAKALARRVEAEARRIETTFSRFLPDSLLSRINAQAGIAPVPADAETRFLVKCALDLAQLTGGRFDPTVGILRKAWDFKQGRVPSTNEVETLLPLVDAASVRVSESSIFLPRTGMELDLGGVGKEYAVDRAADILRAGGAESAIVNFAGDVRTLGRRGDGRPWSIGVQDPRDRSQCLFAIRVRAQAGIATSGDYERAFEKDGVRYHHLLDATTGWPARGIRSATVIAPTALAAGRMATAAFLLGPEQGLRLLDSEPNVEGALITEGGAILRTAGMERIAEQPSQGFRMYHE